MGIIDTLHVRKKEWDRRWFKKQGKKKLKDKPWNYCWNDENKEYLRRKKIVENNSQKWPTATGQEKPNNISGQMKQ